MSNAFFEVRIRTPLARFDLDYELTTNARSVGVFGPSGAGKTTVIETIAGWRKPAAGFIRIGDRVLFDSERGIDTRTRDRRIGYVPQDILLFPHWNVIRNVTAGVRHTDANLLRRVIDALELTELLEHAVTQLSGGERRRVALARALCSRPELLLLDEPLTSLDAPLRRRILGDLVRVKSEFDVPMLLISHDPTEVQVLCDSAQFIRRGRVEASGRPSRVVTYETAPDLENVLHGHVRSVGTDGARIRLDAGIELLVPGLHLEAGNQAVLGIRADDILIATGPVENLSARNVVPGTIVRVQAHGEVVSVHVKAGDAADPIVVNVTPSAVRELDLRAELAVFLVLKARSFDVIATPKQPNH